MTACDLMTYSYAFQHAYLATRGYPDFAGLRDTLELRAARADGVQFATMDTLAAEALAVPERIPEREPTRISVEGRGGLVMGSSPRLPPLTSRTAR